MEFRREHARQANHETQRAYFGQQQAMRRAAGQAARAAERAAVADERERRWKARMDPGELD
jgi:hypothetical protein